MVNHLYVGGRVNPTLIELMRLVGIETPDNATLKDINVLLQANCFQTGKFRFQMEGRFPTEAEFELLRQLNCIEQVDIRSDNHLYDGIILLGAFLPRLRSRMEFVIAKHRAGVSAPILYLLGSDRPLDQVREPHELLISRDSPFLREGWCVPSVLPQTEMELMMFLADQLALPHEWQVIPIRTPNVTSNNGVRAANTADTIVEWLKRTFFVSGRFLAISNQPFIGFQHLMISNLFPDSMQVTTIGPESNIKLPLLAYMDNLAKTVFELINFLAKRNRK